MPKSLTFRLGLLLLATTGACGSQPATDYRFVFRGRGEDYAAAVAAAEEWNACGVVRVVVERSGGDEPIDEEPAAIEGPAGCPCDGYTTPSSIRYVHGSADRTRVTLAHEMGHAFDLGHLDGDRVMNPAQTSEHVTAADCAALRDR